MWRSTEEKMRQKAAGGSWLATGLAGCDSSELALPNYYYIYLYHSGQRLSRGCEEGDYNSISYPLGVLRQ